jgi:hypothetical protein
VGGEGRGNTEEGKLKQKEENLEHRFTTNSDNLNVL